jgi:hypothetical protein
MSWATSDGEKFYGLLAAKEHQAILDAKTASQKKTSGGDIDTPAQQAVHGASQLALDILAGVIELEGDPEYAAKLRAAQLVDIDEIHVGEALLAVDNALARLMYTDDDNAIINKLAGGLAPICFPAAKSAKDLNSTQVQFLMKLAKRAFAVFQKLPKLGDTEEVPKQEAA